MVADRANARLQYFTLDGKHLGFVNDLLFTAHFDIRGEVLMVPDLHTRVTLFDKDNKVIVLRTSEGQKITLAKDKVDEMTPDRKSLMPEDLLKALNDQQVRDLFAYLRSTQPLAD